MKNQSVIDATTIPVTFKMDRLGSLIITYKCKHFDKTFSMYVQDSQDINVFLDEYLTNEEYNDIQVGYTIDTRISDEYIECFKFGK